MNDLVKKGEEWLKKNRWLAVFFLAVPFLNESFPTSPLFYTFFMSDIFKYLSISILVFIFVKKKNKPSLLMLSLIALEVMLLISSLLNHENFVLYDYEKMFSDIASVCFFGLVVETFLDAPDDLIKGLFLNFEIAVYSYFFDFTLNLSGEDYYRRGLLATLLLWILPGICVALTYAYTKKKYGRSSLFILAGLYIIYKVWNATAIVALAAMGFVLVLAFLLTRFGKTKNWKIPLSVLIVLAILLNLFVLFIYRGSNYPFVSFIIEKILHKSTSFTERDVIWAEAIRMIKEKPFFGHGSRPVLAVANSFALEYPHSHNQLLQKLNESGIFGLAIFMVMHVLLILKVDKNRNSFLRNVYAAAIFGIAMTYITEAYKKFFIFYLVFFLAYHMDVFENAKIDKGSERKDQTRKKRIEWIDMARGYGMILTIYAHLGHTPFSSWIYSFHMPLFFFISGYLFKAEGGFLEFLKRKVKSLIVPYFGLGLPLIYAYALDNHVNSVAGLSDLVKSLLLQERFLTIWFIACLFFLDLLFYVMNRFFRSDMQKIIVTLLLLVLGLFDISFFRIKWFWNIDACLMALPFFTFGFLLKKHDLIDKMTNRPESLGYMLGAFLLNVSCWYLGEKLFHEHLDMFASRYGFAPLTYLSAFAGILFIVIVSAKHTIACVRYIGENSLLYMAWHQSMIIPWIGEYLDPTRYLVSADFDRIFSYEILGGFSIYKIYYLLVTCILICLCNEFLARSELRKILGR